MPTTVPTPFEDLDLPPRTTAQHERDRARNDEQIAFLAAGTTPRDPDASEASASASPIENDPGELFTTLVDRRSKAGPEVLQFQEAVTDTGQGSLVVPGELLVRHPDGDGTLSPEVDAILRNNNFTAPEADAPSIVCPELDGLLTVYTYEGDQDSLEATRTAMQQLQGQAKASPHLVTALQQHDPPPPPRPKTVVKAAVGPAPTRVDPCDLDFRWAGFRPPVGETVVAVIDTGIANVAREDGWLKEVTRTRGNIDPLDEFPPPGNVYLDFAAGHGTFAAAIVRLVDPDAQIRVYRALDSDGFATENDVACAMIRAVQDGAHVLNLSNGMHTVDNTPSVAFELALEVIDQIAERQDREPPAIVASAGNYGDSEPVWPAALDGVTAVAALKADLGKADWSSYGDWVDCSCVGEGIVSTFVPGAEDPEFSRHHPEWPQPDRYPLPGQHDAWAVWTGTSFAAPQIAGAISRTMREEGLPPRDAAQQLLAHGVPIPQYGQALRLLPGT